MKWKRIEILVWSLILLMVGGCGISKIVQECSNHCAVSLGAKVPAGQANTDENRIRQSLEGVTTPDGLASEDAYADLARFDTPTENSVVVTLIQGHFTPNEITPAKRWSKLASNLVLVNSVDQNQSTDTDTFNVAETAMAHSANPGCDVHGWQDPLNPGDVKLHPCRGPYSKDGFYQMENLAIVTYTAKGTVKLCYDFSRESDPEHSDCLKSLKLAIGKVFDDVATLKPKANGIVFPAIATGNGHLSKRVFYAVLFSEIQNQLQQHAKVSGLPGHIYLLVDSKQDADQWFDTKASITEQLSAMIKAWNDIDHPAPADWSSLTGVCLALGMLLLIVSIRNPKSILGLDLAVLYDGFPSLVIAAWLFASLGVIKASDPFTSLIPSSLDGWPKMAISFLLVLVLVPISRVLAVGNTLASNGRV